MVETMAQQQGFSGPPVFDPVLGGLMPVVVAARAAQHAEAWLDVTRALEGNDLNTTRAAVLQLRSAVNAMGPLVEAIDGELRRREDFAATQAHARQVIDDAMATVRRDVGELSNAVARGKEVMVQTKDLEIMVAQLVKEERKVAAQRSLKEALAESPPNGIRLRVALEMAVLSGVPEEEQEPVKQAIEKLEGQSVARQALADSLVMPLERRDLEAVHGAIEDARLAGLPQEELKVGEDVLYESRKENIWHDLVAIVTDDIPAPAT